MRSRNHRTPTRHRRCSNTAGKPKSSSLAETWSPGTTRQPVRSSGVRRVSIQTTFRSYRIISSPIVAAGLVIAPTRFRPCSRSSRAARGDVTTTHRAWSFDRGPDVPSPVSDGKLLYSVDDRGVVHALDVNTGAIVYGPERLKNDSTARPLCSPTAASTSPARTPA